MEEWKLWHFFFLFYIRFLFFSFHLSFQFFLFLFAFFLFVLTRVSRREKEYICGLIWRLFLPPLSSLLYILSLYVVDGEEEEEENGMYWVWVCTSGPTFLLFIWVSQPEKTPLLLFFCFFPLFFSWSELALLLLSATFLLLLLLLERRIKGSDEERSASFIAGLRGDWMLKE